ncbi:MAG: CpaF family protein [Lachnospiraceae bacterium]|nr:CpaF family protein [Lachnospiraceae bacterium]
MEELKKQIQEEILEEMDLSVDIKDDEIYHMIDDKLDWYSKEHFLSVKDKIMLRKDIFHRLRGLDVLSQLLSKDSITEIMINGHEKIFVEEDGKIYRTNLKFESEARLENVIQQIVAKANRRVNKASPIVDTRLSDGSRVNVLLSPISLDGSILTIRKFAKEGFTMEKLIAMESIDKEVAKRLKILVESKYNIFISGGTGSGKTTFLNALSQFIPKDQRIITIEDSAELRLMQIENLVRLEVRNANIEGENEISMRDLIKSSLRMRPEPLKIKRGEKA